LRFLALSSPSSSSPLPFFPFAGVFAPSADAASSSSFFGGPRRKRYTRKIATMITSTSPKPAPAPPRIAYTRSMRPGDEAEAAAAEGVGVGEGVDIAALPGDSVQQPALRFLF
jgi:hypothetical protein